MTVLLKVFRVAGVGLNAQTKGFVLLLLFTLLPHYHHLDNSSFLEGLFFQLLVTISREHIALICKFTFLYHKLFHIVFLEVHSSFINTNKILPVMRSQRSKLRKIRSMVKLMKIKARNPHICAHMSTHTAAKPHPWHCFCHCCSDGADVLTAP